MSRRADLAVVLVAVAILLLLYAATRDARAGDATQRGAPVTHVQASRADVGFEASDLGYDLAFPGAPLGPATTLPSPKAATSLGVAKRPPVMAPQPVAGMSGPSVPANEGAVSFSWTGEARWCKPTPDKCQNWGNGAMVGAVHSFTFGDEPYRVRVEYAGKVTEVLIVSHCACANRSDRIDLSTAAFDDLAPLSRGVIPVTVTDARFVDRPLPATDTPDQHPLRREVTDTLYEGGTE